MRRTYLPKATLSSLPAIAFHGIKVQSPLTAKPLLSLNFCRLASGSSLPTTRARAIQLMLSFETKWFQKPSNGT